MRGLICTQSPKTSNSTSAEAFCVIKNKTHTVIHPGASVWLSVLFQNIQFQGLKNKTLHYHFCSLNCWYKENLYESASAQMLIICMAKKPKQQQPQKADEHELTAWTTETHCDPCQLWCWQMVNRTCLLPFRRLLGRCFKFVELVFLREDHHVIWERKSAGQNSVSKTMLESAGLTVENSYGALCGHKWQLQMTCRCLPIQSEKEKTSV